MDARLTPDDIDIAAAVLAMRATPHAALAMMLTSAMGRPVDVTATSDARERLDAIAVDADAFVRIRTGRVPECGAMTLVLCAAEHRRDAQRAVEAILVQLKGITKRADVVEGPGPQGT